MSEPEKNAFALLDLQFVNWFSGTPRERNQSVLVKKRIREGPVE
jgi:hypothetical protein